MESVRQRTCIIQGACTDHFITILLIHYVHTFPMLFSSPSTSSTSNSLTHYISMIYSRDSNLESVRQRTCVVQGACTDHFFTILLVHYVHTFPMLFSSPSASIMSNSVTHFISTIYNRDSNLESVRQHTCVIQVRVLIISSPYCLYIMYTLFHCNFPHQVHSHSTAVDRSFITVLPRIISLGFR